MIYSILGIDPDMNLQQIIIDPGNGKTLLSQKLPMWQNMGMMGMINPMMGNMMNPSMIDKSKYEDESNGYESNDG